MEDRRCTYARSKAGLRNCSSLFRSLCLWCNNTCSKHSSKPDHVSKHQSHPPSRQINRSPIHNGSKSTGWKIQRILSRFAKKGAYNQQATNVATHNLRQNRSSSLLTPTSYFSEASTIYSCSLNYPQHLTRKRYSTRGRW